MRPTKLVNALNWRYALGELFLIVLGILIALAISDWNDRRINRTQELALLSEVRAALRTDRAELERNLATVKRSVARIERLSRALKGGAPYEPAMDRQFGAAYGVHGINLNSTAYETVQSFGIQSISDWELRQGITRVFDHYYEQILTQRAIDTGVTLEVMRPYYLRNFRDLRFLESATPIDYAQLVDDTYFHNLVDYRLAVLRSNQLSTYPEAIAEIDAVLALLDQELD